MNSQNVLEIKPKAEQPDSNDNSIPTQFQINSNYATNGEQPLIILLELLEEAILNFQRKEKKRTKNLRYNAKKDFAQLCNYKDPNIIYKMLDPYDSSNAKLGMNDLDKMINRMQDVSFLETYLELKKKELGIE